MRPRIVVSLVAVVLAAAPGPTSAQMMTGEISGRVTDPSDAVLPGVLVTVTGPVLLQPETAVTSEVGTFRFPGVSIGTYAVAFDLAGFRRLVRQDIKVEIGFNASVNVTLELSPITEAVIVKGESPIVDVRDTSRSGRFAREGLDRLPTSRDPWAMIAQTAGVLMSTVNVGGNFSGQQSATAARGDWSWNNKWTLDGVDITDVAATGASSIYFDFDSFQEMQVTTAGGDTAQQTSGIAINVVTRSGTDVFRGSGRFFVTDDSLESENIDDSLRLQGAGAGNPIQNIKDMGVEAGGPLKKGLAWIWGAYGRQDIEVGVVNFYRKTGACAGLTGSTAITYPLETVRACLQPSRTTVWAANLKAQVQLSPRNKLSWFNNFTEKVAPTRAASDLRPFETTWRQGGAPRDYGARLWETGPASLWKAGDQHVFNDRWLLDLQWAHQGNNFAFDFQESSLADIQPQVEIASSAWRRSFNRDVNVRPVDSVTLATEFFKPSWLGGDHAIRVGWRWRGGRADNEAHWGGNTVARYRNGVPADAVLFRDSVTGYRLNTQAGWVQDAYTRPRLTINFGLRWDRQRDLAEASSVGSHPFQGQMTAQGVPFNWLPAVTFAGADAGPTWNDFSPRIAVTYDVSADGRTAVKASFSRYYAQSTAGWTSRVANPVTEARIVFPWSDVNGDGVVDVGELDTTRILAFGGNYDPDNPGYLGTDNRIDPNLDNYRTDEITFGVDRQIGAEFAMAVAYMWRRYSDDLMFATVGLTSADYAPQTWTPPAATCPQPSARCQTIVYWEPIVALPAAMIATNRPDFDKRYHGLEITARKRMRDRWMLDGSVSFNDARMHFRSSRAYQDPTNIDKLDGAQAGLVPPDAVDRLGTPYGNARWVAKLSGAYTSPWWDIGLAGSYQGRQGYQFSQTIQTPSRANRAGFVAVLLDPVGEVRYPALHLIDLGVSRPFRIGPMTVTASVDVFNLANVNTVLSRQGVQNSAMANQVSTIVAPRVIRLGVRASW